VHDVMRFVLAVFACYRLAELVAVDDGPGDIFKKARTIMGAYYRDEYGDPESSLGKLASCPYCVGVYFAAGLALILFPIGWGTLLYWAAIAGGQAFLQNVGGRV